ncbi:Rho GTPase activation protein [Phycomyces blakesleeanus]
MRSSETSFKPDRKWSMNPLLLLIKSKQFFYSNYTTYNSVQPKASMIKGIFGAPLEYAAMCGSTSFHPPLDLCVPSPVHRCFTEIIKRGLYFEGIFRLSGAASEVSRLQDAFDQPPTYGKYLDLTNYDIHSITSVVKKYLRNLPDSVIPMAVHEQFLQTTEMCRSPVEAINLVALLIADLPVAHNHLLRYIFILVSHIREHETVNKMNPEALATVLAPVCAGLEHTLKDLPDALKKKKTKVLMKSDMIGVVERNRRWTELWILMIDNLDVLLLRGWKDHTPNHRALSMQFTNQKGHLTVPSRPSPSSMVRRPSSPTSSSPYQALMQQFYVPVLSGDSLHSLHIGSVSQEPTPPSPLTPHAPLIGINTTRILAANINTNTNSTTTTSSSSSLLSLSEQSSSLLSSSTSDALPPLPSRPLPLPPLTIPVPMPLLPPHSQLSSNPNPNPKQTSRSRSRSRSRSSSKSPPQFRSKSQPQLQLQIQSQSLNQTLQSNSGPPPLITRRSARLLQRFSSRVSLKPS